MKITVSEDKVSSHKNPAIYAGKLYIIRKLRNPHLSDNSKPGTIFLAGYVYPDGKCHYFDAERITHSPYSYANANYNFEEFQGTITIECP